MLTHLSGPARSAAGRLGDAGGADPRGVAPRLAEASSRSRRHLVALLNLAFALLGEVVARVYGGPRGVPHRADPRATWDGADDVDDRRACRPRLPRRGLHGRPRHEPIDRGRAVAPAADLDDAGDLCRWGRSSPATIRRPLAGHVEQMRTFRSMVDLTKWLVGCGIGFEVYRLDERVFVGHGGATAGFLARVSALPAAKTGAAVLTNRGAGVRLRSLASPSRRRSRLLPPVSRSGRPARWRRPS